MTRLPPPKNIPFVLSRFLFVVWFLMCPSPPRVVASDVPRVPFAGVYGATAGGGSLTGWERHGGDNPAVTGAPGYAASLSGYAPFGLGDLRVTELEASRDVARWGVSVGWRHLADEGGSDASRVRAQLALRAARRLDAGAFVSAHWSGNVPSTPGNFGGRDGDAWWGAGVGLRARPHQAFSLGMLTEILPSPLGRIARAGLGADVGTSLSRVLGAGSEGRVSAEYFREFGLAPGTPGTLGTPGIRAEEWRFALGLRLHALLGVYAGYAPGRETAALGVAFGAGGWEGFSAVRRHGALGGTAVQGLGWGKRVPESK